MNTWNGELYFICQSAFMPSCNLPITYRIGPPSMILNLLCMFPTIHYKGENFESGALHTGPWIWIQCRSGIRIQRPLYLHTTLIWIQAACYATSDSEWDPVQQCNVYSLLGIWSSHKTMHIESGLGIRIQLIRFQCPCGEPQQLIQGAILTSTAAILGLFVLI